MQEEKHYSVLCEIREILKELKTAQKARPNIDKIEQISAYNPLVLDYKNRYHIFLWSPNTLTLSLEDLGTMTLTQYVWTNLSFMTGFRIFATGQATLVPIYVRCTDQTVQ